MKYSQNVSSSRRKSRKAHFTAPSSLRRKIMSSALSKELKEEHNVNAMPIRVKDEVIIVRGSNKDTQGVVTAVARNKYGIRIEGVKRDKKNGQSVDLLIHPSNVQIVKLHLDKDRLALLSKKAASKASIEASA
ncbi:50S ribosomal protein L24P [Ramicandelaber brevisporus]|nr:50S ribosomal protein L24P [Ramicandelaber brevisporus]